MDSRQVLARFEAERQALAMMDHPNIAKVFDGGMTEQGRPYLRDGVRQGRAADRVLRPGPAFAEGTPATVRAGLPGGAACASERDHPPRPEAVEHSGLPVRRQAGSEGDRLWPGQGDAPVADRSVAVHGAWA